MLARDWMGIGIMPHCCLLSKTSTPHAQPRGSSTSLSHWITALFPPELFASVPWCQAFVDRLFSQPTRSAVYRFSSLNMFMFAPSRYGMSGTATTLALQLSERLGKRRQLHTSCLAVSDPYFVLPALLHNSQHIRSPT